MRCSYRTHRGTSRVDKNVVLARLEEAPEVLALPGDRREFFGNRRKRALSFDPVHVFHVQVLDGRTGRHGRDVKPYHRNPPIDP